jgi:hypothetical protein
MFYQSCWMLNEAFYLLILKVALLKTKASVEGIGLVSVVGVNA